MLGPPHHVSEGARSLPRRKAMIRSKRRTSTTGLLTLGLALALLVHTACESSDGPSVKAPEEETIEGACTSADECLLLPPPTDCNGDWFCEEGLCQHHCTFAACEAASDCTIEEKCEDGFCVPDVDNRPPVTCVETGCSGEICSEEPMDSACVERVEHECLVLTTCGAFGPDGTCGWEQNDAYLDCLAALVSPPDPCADVKCDDGEICVDGACEAVDPCLGMECSDTETCVDGACVPNDAPDCEADEDCEDGEICSEGTCEDKGGDPISCYVSGCSGEVCSAEFMVNSDCAWLPEYECLLFTVCGAYGEGGTCGWEPNEQYLSCLDGIEPPVEGCASNEDCAPEEVCINGTCASKPPLPPGACLSSADCKPGAQCINGMCVGGGAGGECIVTGCSGEICAPMETMSDCAWLPEYDCLQYTQCGSFGVNGFCHWEKTPEYLECLLNVGDPATGMCVSDADCTKPGSKCNANEICLPPPDGSPADVCWGQCVPKQAGDTCEGVGDCPDGMICECVGGGGGGFVPPNAFVPPCVNLCVPTDDPPPVDDGMCQSDADCKDPWTKCNAADVCLPPPDGGMANVCWGECVPKEAGDACIQDADCPGDMLCQCGGFGAPNAFVPCFLECTPPDDPPPADTWCAEDADCPPGQICDSNGPSPWAFPPPPDEGAPPPPLPSGSCTNPCITTGCSGIICAAEPVNSTCNWEPSYACYAEDLCGAFGENGACQWQENEAFETCMESFDNQ